MTANGLQFELSFLADIAPSATRGEMFGESRGG